MGVAALTMSACSSDGADSTTPEPTPIEFEASDSDDDASADVPDEYLAAVLSDVATYTGTPPQDFTVLDATGVEWASQRLGCVHFEEPPAPAPVDGYRVVVDAAGVEYDYRLDESGAFRLCGDPLETTDGADSDGHHGDGEADDADGHEHDEAPDPTS